MTVTFFTNFINHHQVFLADELFRALGDGYRFVACEAMPDSFANSGYPDYSDRPYLVAAYQSPEAHAEAMRLGWESDIVITGSAPECYISKRLKANKHTFRYSERLFKRRLCRAYFNPKYWVTMLMRHTLHRGKNFYMLCASAYTAPDAARLFAYPNKCYRWGYFPRVDQLDISTLLQQRVASPIKLMWCGRFVGWKHPELPIQLAARLKAEGYHNIEINLIGSGEAWEATKALARRLEVTDMVHFRGNVPNEQVLEEMRSTHIFLFTSDRNEGWGAVLNEAMGSGCAVVASDQIGATPFLLRHAQSGMIFKSGSVDSLTASVKELLDNRSLREQLSLAAYHTLRDEWSPKVATSNFILLASSLLRGKEFSIPAGPCSKITCNK